MLDANKHVFIYPNENGLDEISLTKLRKFSNLLHKPMYTSPVTKIVVISNAYYDSFVEDNLTVTKIPEDKKTRALQRGEMVISELEKLIGKKKTENLVVHWIFPFLLRKGEFLRRDDMPPLGHNFRVWFSSCIAECGTENRSADEAN